MSDSCIPSVPTVVLRHELPDGSWHIDWMIAPPAASADASPRDDLITLRLTQRPDELGQCDSAPAVRLPDHRWAYLDYEGEVSAGRGFVSRLRRGEVVWNMREPSSWSVRVAWKDGPPFASPQAFVIECRGNDRWNVRCTAKGESNRSTCP